MKFLKENTYYLEVKLIKFLNGDNWKANDIDILFFKNDDQNRFTVKEFDMNDDNSYASMGFNRIKSKEKYQQFPCVSFYNLGHGPYFTHVNYFKYSGKMYWGENINAQISRLFEEGMKFDQNVINFYMSYFDRYFNSDLFKIMFYKDKLYFKNLNSILKRKSDYYLFPSQDSVLLYNHYNKNRGIVCSNEEILNKFAPFEKYKNRGYDLDISYRKKSKLEFIRDELKK